MSQFGCKGRGGWRVSLSLLGILVASGEQGDVERHLGAGRAFWAWLDTGTLSLMTRRYGLDPFTARLLSEFAFGMTATFFLNRNLTFRDRKSPSILTEYLRFAGSCAIGNTLNYLTHAGLVEYVDLVRRIPELGIFAGTAIGLVFNFTGAKYFVFRQR